mmetsp:Transcript_10839/g.23856  ORF Transcript_10839/g.23856 Transcript_10839/m.23856 type:complete len:99 (+) Transcript_10839:2557-2853(+)
MHWAKTHLKRERNHPREQLLDIRESLHFVSDRCRARNMGRIIHLLSSDDLSLLLLPLYSLCRHYPQYPVMLSDNISLGNKLWLLSNTSRTFCSNKVSR